MSDTQVKITPAERVTSLEKYIFVELAEAKEEARKRGVKIIDLGMGNPDRPTPDYIVKRTIKSIKDPKSHGYPNFRGKPEFQAAIKEWMKKRHDVVLDSSMTAQAVNGGKEGIAHISLTFTDVGDVNLIPDPYYPVFSRGTLIAGGQTYLMPLLEENNFLPDLDAIPADIAKKAKLMIVNYPNNPTGAVAPKWFLEKAVKFCRENNILLLSDMAYAEICYDGYRPLSIFSIEGAKDVALEVHTCSKTFNMAGWRVGFIIGKQEFIDALFALKVNFDYGTSTIMQDAAIAAMEMPHKYVEATMNKYKERRDYLVGALRELGWDLKTPDATFYLWVKVPQGYNSKEFCKMVMDKSGVVFTPGIAFGKNGDNYFRVSLVQDIKVMKQAVKKLKEAGIHYS